jgi:hypothetical protein
MITRLLAEAPDAGMRRRFLPRRLGARSTESCSTAREQIHVMACHRDSAKLPYPYRAKRLNAAKSRLRIRSRSNARSSSPHSGRDNFVRGGLWHAFCRIVQTPHEIPHTIPQVGALCSPLAAVPAPAVPDAIGQPQRHLDETGRVRRSAQQLTPDIWSRHVRKSEQAANAALPARSRGMRL